jgi:hypothetical protein
MATYKPLQSISLTSDTTTVTFSGIPQDYTDLEVVISARCSNSSNANFYYRVNGDSSSAYSVTRLQGNGSTVVSNRGSSNTVGYIGYTDAADSSSSIFGVTKIYINSYSNSTTNKTLISRTGTPGTSGTTASFVNLYRGSTSPITSISFTPDAGNWVAGSTFDLYGIKSGAPQALGGDLVTTDGNYWYHTFRTTQTFTPQRPLTVDYLVVAGGGGGAGVASGGNYGAPGGGAGGLRSTVTASGGSPGTVESALSLTGQAYTITIGAGGARSEKGSNSTLHTITSEGGGLAPNGSGGSGAGAFSFGTLTPGSGTANQGFAGAAAAGNTSPGGGGGAGGAGSSARTGGAGVSTSISGTSTAYAGGGGGGWGGTATAGGGAGGAANTNANGTAGTANTGGGGGGSSVSTGDTLGAPGGSGIVIVRYPV